MRRAVGLWQAIGMILLVSGMMIVVLRYASVGAKHTADSYVWEQAELLVQSAVEQTLLKISEHNRTVDGCLRFPDIIQPPEERGKKYTVFVEIERYYMYGETCADPNLYTPIQSPESHGYVLLHVELNATIDGTQKVRILRKTLQRA
ncbi:MAG: hypothetical protein JXK05_06670 [Campylobacterales bacterium]|nr:hypothetical protein [Campylobacterales bacterium]